jgi:hypothetical protein
MTGLIAQSICWKTWNSKNRYILEMLFVLWLNNYDKGYIIHFHVCILDLIFVYFAMRRCILCIFEPIRNSNHIINHYTVYSAIADSKATVIWIWNKKIHFTDCLEVRAVLIFVLKPFCVYTRTMKIKSAVPKRIVV